MIPPQLLRQRMTIIIPAPLTDGYGDEQLSYDPSDGAVRLVDVPALLTQDAAREDTDARNAQVGEWSLSTNSTQVTGSCRIEYDGRTLHVLGPVALIEDEIGRVHSLARLREATG